MSTSVTVSNPSDDETKSQTEHHHLLRPPTQVTPTVFKPLPEIIKQSVEVDRRHRLPHSRSTADFLNVNQSSIDTTDDDLDDSYDTTTTTTTTTISSLNKNRNRSFQVRRVKRSPSDIRVSLYPDVPRHLINSQIEISNSSYDSELRSSNPSLIDTKSSKQNRVDHLRCTLLDHRFGRRIHSSFSSSTTLRSLNRRRSAQNIPQRQHRRHPHSLSRNSKWHFVRIHLHDIALMSAPYARMKLIERDLRWMHLREQIRKQVLDMREMSILRQEDEGLLKKSQKTSFNLKAIPINQVVHVERDGRVYSIGTRDLVLGRLIGGEDIQLDAFVQLDARRKFQVKQTLLRQQEGRTRLKKHIAFSFCLCNLSFIVLMFAAMFIFAVRTMIQLRQKYSS